MTFILCGIKKSIFKKYVTRPYPKNQMEPGGDCSVLYFPVEIQLSSLIYLTPMYYKGICNIILRNSSLLSVVVRVSVVLKKTVVVDID